MFNKAGKYLWKLSERPSKTLPERLLTHGYLSYRKLKNSVSKGDTPHLSRLYLHARSKKRRLMSQNLLFISIEDAVIWTFDFIKTFPETYDVIIGIPRSGMLMASLIALKLGKPLSTPDLFIQKRFWASVRLDTDHQPKRVLLIDDTILHGKTMRENAELLKIHCPDVTVRTAALVVTEETKSHVDLYYKQMHFPRAAEWTLMHHKRGKLASDLDGVLCENCPKGIDSDEKRYIEWMQNAKPYLIPAFEIDFIITSRLEKYRLQTEAWLQKHGVRYKDLLMWDIPSKADRKGRYAEHKINQIIRIKPDLFWESTLSQAQKIHSQAGIPCLCFDEMVFLD